jgi:hypothetical protein
LRSSSQTYGRSPNGIAARTAGLFASASATRAQMIIFGNAFMQDLRRGHREPGNGLQPTVWVAAAFTELAQAI